MANEFKIKKGLIVTGASGGTVVDIQGSQGQLFSVTDDLSGSIFAVSDISGVPILDVNSSGLSTFAGNIAGNTNNTTEVGTYSTGAIKRIRMVQGGELHFGDTTTAAPLGITEGDWNQFADQDRLSIYGRNSIKFYSGGISSALQLTLDTNATFAGQVTATEFYVVNNNFGLDTSGNYLEILGYDGFKFRNSQFNAVSLTIEDNAAATFAGKATSLATAASDGSTTLTTKSYVDGLVTGVPVYKGTWAAGTTGVTSAAISGTTITLTAAPTETIAVGDVVTADGIIAATTVTAVASQTSVTVSATVVIANTITVTFSPEGGYPDLTLAAAKVLGNYYIVSTAGSATPNGTGTEPDSWAVGDWAIFSDVTPGAGTDLWQRIDNSSVISGAGTGKTIPLWEGETNAVSETLTDSPITVSGNDTTFAGTVAAATYYKSSGTSAVLGTNASGEVLLRPTSSISSTAQSSFTTTLATIGTDATFAGDLALGGTGQYTTNQSLNIDGTGLAIKNNVNGSSNNWSYIHNTATASSSNLVFATGAALTALTLAHSGAATFAGTVTAPTFLGDLGATSTINTGVTGFTQTAGNNSTLIATTAYADAAAGAVPIGNYLPLVGGTLTGPGNLTVNGTTQLDHGGTTHKTIFGSGNEINTFLTDGSATTMYLNYSSGTTNIGNSTLVVQNQGNVGVGNTTPDFRLHTNLNLSGSPLAYLNGTSNTFDATANLGVTHNSTAVGTGTAAGVYLANNANNDGAPSPIIAFSALAASGSYNHTYAAIYGIKTAGGADTNWVKGDLTFATGNTTGPERRMTILANGNVGIGTTSPDSLLHIYNSSTSWDEEAVITLGTDIEGTTQAQLRYYRGLTDATTESFQLSVRGTTALTALYNGNVGIGTTSPVGKLYVGPTWDTTSGGNNLYIKSPGATNDAYDPQVQQTTALGITMVTDSATTTGPDTVGLTLYNDDGTAGGFSPMLLFSKLETPTSQYKATMAGIYARSPLGTGNGGGWIDGELIFATAGAASQGIKQRMVINKEGLVGIGTTTPLAKLDIQGTQGQLFSVTDDLSGSIFAVADISGVPIFDVNSSGVSYFDGNVGIGTTSPAQLLDVNGIADINSIIIGTNGDNMYHNGSDFYIKTETAHALIFRTSNTNRLTIEAGGDAIFTGNVGIGTTSPGAKLDVIGETRISYAPSNQYRVRITNSDGNGRILVDGDTSSLIFGTSGAGTNATATERMRIDSAGDVTMTERVGIGVTSFTAGVKLEVAGNIKADGSFYLYSGTTRYFSVGAYSNAPYINTGTSGGTVYIGAPTTWVTNLHVQGTTTATNFILSSDERLKENIEKACDNRIKADWKTFELKTEKGQKRYGVIAQELEKTNPEFVREDTQGFKSVAYIDLLIAKIAELEARLEKAGI